VNTDDIRRDRDYLTITVERHTREDGSDERREVRQVRSAEYDVRAFTSYTDRDLSELLWAMIVRAAFDDDPTEDQP
jgi:hypothetical protein